VSNAPGNFNRCFDDRMKPGLAHQSLSEFDSGASSLLWTSDEMGRIKREAVWTLGEEQAHGFLTRWGSSLGRSVTLHRPSGGMNVLIANISSYLRHDSDMHWSAAVPESIEALGYLTFYDTAEQPQCDFTAGYLTGHVSEEEGLDIFFLETECRAKGDRVCRFVGQPRSLWNERDKRWLERYSVENISASVQQLQEQLRLTKDRYQNLFEQSGSAILILDPDSGHILNANQAASELSGYSTDALLRMNVFDFSQPDEHNQLMNDLKELSHSEHTVERELSFARSDGTIRVVAHTGKILTYDGQRVVQSVMRDVTTLKLAERKEKELQDQLMRSERLSSIGRLAAGVAHELKNPLGAIRNAVYYIRNALRDNPVLETDPHLKTILKLAEEEVDSSVVIIGELLDFSRVVQLVQRRTQLNEVLEKMVGHLAVPENIELLWDLDVTLPHSSVDPDRLKQVFSNIMTNAFQAMPGGGKLRIKSELHVETSAETDGNREMIAVTFEDTGSGIDPAHLAKIFEPLFTTKARGTGLGLAISRNIVEKHGGQIFVRSQIGKGTSFTVKLPLTTPADKEDKV
jgi:PAS domain S-box-containing protein